MSRLFALLLLASVAYGQERIVVLSDSTDTRTVQAMLNEGWTVKHQSVAVAMADTFKSVTSLIVITLSPPAPEVIAANEEKARLAREAAWKKKREEFEKSRQVEKSK